MIKGISHLGLAVKDLQDARNFYHSIFGFDSTEPIMGGGGTVKASLINVGNTTVELLEPFGNEGAIAKFLVKHGEGIHHICYEVDNIEEEINKFKTKGLEVIGKPTQGAEGLSIFLHPKGTHGLLIELVEK